MKILSVESDKDSIDYKLKKDLLIPCWIYKVPIETSRENKLNFLEETILELTDIDDSLFTDIDRLSSLLGFENKDIIKLVLKRLKQLKLSDRNDDIEKNEVNVYLFYQEAYTGELLPIITKDLNEFSYPENNKKFQEDIYREIAFKQRISSNRKTKAILVDRFNEQASAPTREDIIKSIYLHNQKNYENFSKIECEDFKIDIVNTNELIYLHVKLYMPKNSNDSIIVSNGFSNDYSILFREIYKNQHQNLISYFRSELKQDIELKANKIDVPFENKIINFPEVLKNIQEIENNKEKLNHTNSKASIIFYKDKIMKSLYDGLEQTFKNYVKNLKDTESLKNKNLLYELALKAGFNLNIKIDKLPIFNISKQDNLQKFIAKSLFYKKDEIYEVAMKYPNLLYTISNLFSIRNSLKHSGHEETLTNIEISTIENYIKTIYLVISLILRIKEKSNINNIENNDDIYFQNSYIDLEVELSIDILKELPQEVQNNLVYINYYLNELNFEENKYIIVKEIINQLYSSFEYIFKNIVAILCADRRKITCKDEIIEKIGENNLNISLLSVNPINIEEAQKNQKASLGAYFLVYLYYLEDIDTEVINLLQKILVERKHSNPSIEEIEQTSLEYLRKLKIDSFKLIKILMENN